MFSFEHLSYLKLCTLFILHYLDIETNISDITQVIYYTEGIEIAAVSSAPYEATWLNALAGDYEIFAKVFYSGQSVAAISNPVCISVIASDPNAPTVNLRTSSLEVSGAFELRIDFDKEGSGLSITDFEITNGSLLSDMSNVGTSYYITVVPTNIGTVSILLPADRVTDFNGNGNLISNILMVNYETEDEQSNEGCTTISNVALNGVASLSSVYGGGDGEADLAIDGNTNGNWFVDFSVSSTGWEEQAYWEIDLGRSYNIEDINIWKQKSSVLAAHNTIFSSHLAIWRKNGERSFQEGALQSQG